VGVPMSGSQRGMSRSPLLAIYAVLVFAFLYLPIAVLIIYSFNGEGVGGFPPKNLRATPKRAPFSPAGSRNLV